MNNAEKREIVCDALEAEARQLPINYDRSKTLMTAVGIMEIDKMTIGALVKDIADYQDMLTRSFMLCDILIKALDKREGRT